MSFNLSAPRDQNSVPALLAVSSADGTSLVEVWADPDTHRLLVDMIGGGGGFAIETPVGLINGVNDVFTVSNVPGFITINGVAYYQNNGYTLSGLTITIDPSLTPVTGSVLRSIYGASSDPGVTSIIAGTNITLSPSSGVGAVTINASGGSSSVRGTFTNASLSAGILTVTHSFGLSTPYQVQVTVVNNSSQSIIPPFICATNTVAIDLSALGTISGTYGYLISQ